MPRSKLVNRGGKRRGYQELVLATRLALRLRAFATRARSNSAERTVVIPHTPEDIEQLNSFLRGELAAVETYDQCIRALDDRQLAPPLRALRRSHRERADQLADRIDELGGDPDKHSGAWGGFARLIEGGAKALGDREAMAMLERGESHGQADYERGTRKLSPPSRKFIAERIEPEQRWTRDSLRQIRRHNS